MHLLEIGLPGMDGYEVARRLYPHSPRERRPLLVAAPGLGAEDRCHSDEAGIDWHLAEPVDPNVLCGVLNRFHQIIEM